MFAVVEGNVEVTRDRPAGDHAADEQRADTSRAATAKTGLISDDAESRRPVFRHHRW